VVAVLNQPNAGEVAGSCALDNSLHQTAPDPTVLRRRIDGDRAETGDRRAFVEEIAAEYASILLGHDAIEPGMVDQHRGEAHRNLRGREVTGKIVLVGNGGKGGADDPPAFRGVICRGGP
jgi:hypothetical protein